MIFNKPLPTILGAIFAIALLGCSSAVGQSRPPLDETFTPRFVTSSEFYDSDIDYPQLDLPRRDLFLIKTNLLFDLATVINIEAEIPIGDRYSICGEWIFPWWLSDSRQRALQILCGTLEGRYWWGNREEQPQLTGWATGLYVGCGYYDLEWDGKGYQGENVFAGGLSVAYAHPIGRALRLEYSLGLGLLWTKYRHYEAQNCNSQWSLLRTDRGRLFWFGPTRCRVSLAWMIGGRDKRGGVR